jgi:microcystin-dependent protein
MSGFYKNGVDIVQSVTGPPVGSIMPYVGGGTTTSGTNPGDPAGWIICDGQLRTSTDGRYASLAPIMNTYMGVTTNTSNYIIPPDLRSKFIYGQASTATITKSNGGASTVTLTSDNIPSHNHKTLNSGYGGTFWTIQGGYVENAITSFEILNIGSTGPGVSGKLFTSQFSDTKNMNTSSVGSGQSFDILPPYITMNYIIKYS